MNGKYQLTPDNINKLTRYLNNLKFLYRLLDKIKEDYLTSKVLKEFISDYSELIVEKTEELARVEPNKCFDGTSIFNGEDKQEILERARAIIKMEQDGLLDKKYYDNLIKAHFEKEANNFDENLELIGKLMHCEVIHSEDEIGSDFEESNNGMNKNSCSPSDDKCDGEYLSASRRKTVKNAKTTDSEREKGCKENYYKIKKTR